MHYMVGLYGAPADADHFRRHYLTTHLPLAAKLPGLVRMHHSFAVETLGPGETYFCIWTGAFPDEATASAAMASPEGQALAADVPNYASGGMTLFRYTAEEFAG